MFSNECQAKRLQFLRLSYFCIILAETTGLTDCELHLVSLSSQVQGQEEEKRQEALLPRLIKSLMAQKDLKRFAVYHSAEGQSRQIDISAINLSELVQSFQKLWVKIMNMCLSTCGTP